MDFIFQGFDSALPLWLYLLIFIATAALAWWSYSNVKGIQKSYRYILTALRTAIFFILLLLLLNPFFKKETYYYEKPNILVMLDNSASTSIQKSDYQGIESYDNVLSALDFTDSSKVNYQFFSIGDQTQKTAGPKELNHKADQTNLSETMRTIREKQADANAVVLLSDGIFTKGQNPIYETDNIDLPIFTIGLGDTTSQKDIMVRSVSTNSTGYLHSSQPVTVSVSSKGFKGKAFQVRLKKDNRSIARKTVRPSISNSSQDVTFELPLEQEGLQQFQVEIPKLADEWTGANNTQLFSVDVKDAKQKVLSLAFEIYPDVKFIRSLLLRDKNIEAIPRTWLSANRFVEGSLNFDPDTLDLAIIEGYPQAGLPGKLKKKVSNIVQNVPTIVVATPLFSPRRYEKDIGTLPVSISGSWDYSEVNIHPAVAPGDHPVMELPTVTYANIPAISAPISHLDKTAGPTTLFNSSYRGQDTQKPVLTVQEVGNKRRSFFCGFGWFRLDQSTNPQVRDFVEQLWLNTISWTAANPQNELLDVQPTQKSFTGSEPVTINAYLNNERGEVESDATIEISISSDSTKTRFYSMDNDGAGKYQLKLGTMPEGLYSFEATAKKGNRTIDTQKGEFAVARSNAEFITTGRNDQLLRQLASRTSGSYTPFDSISTGFWRQLDQRGLLSRNKEQQTTFFYLYRHASWFIIVILLLCVEWIFRKYLSLP